MNNRRNGLFRNSLFYILMFLSLMGIIYFFFGGNSGSQTQNIRYSEFVKQLDKNNVKNVSIQPSGGVYKVTGSYRKARTTSSANALGIKSASTKTTSFSTTMLENNSTVDQVSKLAAKHDVKVTAKAEESSGIWVTLLMYIAPVILMLFLFYMMMGQAGQGGGNNRVMNFGKTKAKPADSKQNKVRFSDVAGEEEEKQELVEVVEFLKDPRKFVSLGARIPSGVLLDKLAAKHDVKVTAKAEESSGIWVTLLMYIAPVILMLFLFYMMMGQAGQGGGNNRVMNFGKTKAKPADSKQNKVRFSDVAGEEEEKQELVEVVEFLKDPRKFVSLGARIPSGVLLDKLAAKHDVKVTAKAEESSGIWVTLLKYIAPVILMLFLFYMMMGQAVQGGGNNRVMNFG
ncbi:hypothetical protein WP50_07890, partial [Lactiplantibacillus plantarum]